MVDFNSAIWIIALNINDTHDKWKSEIVKLDKREKRYKFKRCSWNIKIEMVEGKRIQEDIPCKCKHAKADSAILVSDKMKFKTRMLLEILKRYFIVTVGQFIKRHKKYLMTVYLKTEFQNIWSKTWLN